MGWDWACDSMKYSRVMPAGPKVAGFSTDSRFHVAMLDLRYHAVGKHGGHISGAAFPNHALGVGVNQVPYFFYVRCVVAWLLPSC